MKLGFGYRISITPADVGARVSIRRRLASGQHSDAVGELLGWADGMLTVRRRDGTVTEIAEDALVAGKRVPPPPMRTATTPATTTAAAMLPGEEPA